MIFAANIYIEDTKISNITNPAPSIPVTSKITDLFSGGGFSIINLVFVVIGFILFANIVMAGWDYMFSSGDPKKTSAATTRLINGVIGFVMALAAFIIVNLVTNIIGLGNLV